MTQARGRPSPDSSSVLRAGLEELGVADPERVQRLLEPYLDELERWNPRFGLVKAADRHELVVKHILDSLSGWRAVREAVPDGGSALDVGSGAGLPGIPLAAALPDLHVTLLERMSRRAAFLKTCGTLLALPRLRVVCGDLASATGSYDVIVFRAVAPFGRFLQDAAASKVRWRTAVAYKGKEDRAGREIEEARAFVGDTRSLRLVRIRAPFLDEERCLIVASDGSRQATPGIIVDKPEGAS